MTPAELMARKRQRPFVPFRVLMNDGRTFPVHHHRLLLVGRTWAVIGIPPQGSTGPIYEGTATINLTDITRLEPFEQGPTPTQQTAGS